MHIIIREKQMLQTKYFILLLIEIYQEQSYYIYLLHVLFVHRLQQASEYETVLNFQLKLQIIFKEK